MKIQLDLFLQRFPLHLLKQKGADCPWCGRLLAAYGYDLDYPHLDRAYKILRWCYDHQNPVFSPKEVFGGTDTQFSRLRYWGIIEPLKKAYKWRLTKSGVRWLRGRSTLHKKVWVYDGEVIDRDSKQIWVYDVEPRWKTEYSHWVNDYLLYPQEPMRPFAPKLL